MDISPTASLASNQPLYTSGASESFTNSTIDAWRRQRLDSPRGQQFLQVISDKTGISTADLESRLKSGSTLNDILQASGVSFADIRAAVRQQGNVRPPNQGHHNHHNGGAKLESVVIDAIAGKLGMDGQSLTTALAGGTSLTSLAGQHGVSGDDLAQAIGKAMETLLGYDASGTPASSNATPPAQVNETV